MIGETEWRQHAELVGRVALAWNRNTAMLLRIFTFLTGIESPLADTIFFTIKSDKQQRDLVRRVADVTLVSDDARDALAGLLDRLGRLSARRNSAVHTVFGISLFDPASMQWGPQVVPALNPPQDPKLDRNFKAQFERAERDLTQVLSDLDNWLTVTPRKFRHPRLQPPTDWTLYENADVSGASARNL